MKEKLELIVNEEIISQISGTGKVETKSGKIFFLKTGNSSTTYQNEANGLKELEKAKAIKVAKVISAGDKYILTEYIEQGVPNINFFENFGKQFAQMHKTQNKGFGFYEDNYIGPTQQQNISDEGENWIDFYFNKRLLFQYQLAEENRYVTPSLRSRFKNIEQCIEKILVNSLEPPCLLHGDLWSGNFLCNVKNEVVLIDPAVYYGHREADLAMTRVFGGFPQSFYDAYNTEYPLIEGWEYRQGIYKLYHILNHLNIFGRSYLSKVEYLLKQYV